VVQENPVGRLPAEGQGSWENRRETASNEVHHLDMPFLHRITLFFNPGCWFLSIDCSLFVY
jgi:hypothetical protein